MLNLDAANIPDWQLINMALEGGHARAFDLCADYDGGDLGGLDVRDVMQLVAVRFAIKSLESDGGFRAAKKLRDDPVSWLTRAEPEECPVCESVSNVARLAFADGLHLPERIRKREDA